MVNLEEGQIGIYWTVFIAWFSVDLKSLIGLVNLLETCECEVNYYQISRFKVRKVQLSRYKN